MKKTINLLLAFIMITAVLNPLKAQDSKKELSEFVKQFEDAYNKKDSKAIKDMFTKDATRKGSDGKIQNNNAEIEAAFEGFFKDDLTLTIAPEKDAKQKDGSTLSTGTFRVAGTTASGEKVDDKGAYANTVVKVDGHWKISKQVITSLDK